MGAQKQDNHGPSPQEVADLCQYVVQLVHFNNLSLFTFPFLLFKVYPNVFEPHDAEHVGHLLFGILAGMTDVLGCQTLA